MLWLPDAKNWLIGKDPDSGKDWRQKEKGMTEDEMVGWHHRLNGHEFEQVPGVGDRQWSLACCSPWGHKESDMSEWLNWRVQFYMTLINLSFWFQDYFKSPFLTKLKSHQYHIPNKISELMGQNRWISLRWPLHLPLWAIALKHVYYHMWNSSPVQFRCMRQGAQGWCTGMTLRDGMGREVGGGFRIGNTCTSMTDSCQYMAKTTTIL